MRKGLINFKVLVLLISAIPSACSNSPSHSDKKQEIRLQVVRQSSHLIHCSAIFGYSVKKLEEENEILIQLGTIDTTDDEQPKIVAVIKTGDAEKILYLVNSHTDQQDDKSLITRQFTGEGYNLLLTYNDIQNSRIVYEGNCVITKGNLKTEYELEGEPNIHDY